MSGCLRIGARGPASSTPRAEVLPPGDVLGGPAIRARAGVPAGRVPVRIGAILLSVVRSAGIRCAGRACAAGSLRGPTPTPAGRSARRWPPRSTGGRPRLGATGRALLAGPAPIRRPGTGPVSRRIPGSHGPGSVPRVPLATPERIGQQQVRLLDRQETERVATGRVGVVALGELAMRRLDLRFGGCPLHAQLAVRVRDSALHAHQSGIRLSAAPRWAPARTRPPSPPPRVASDRG